MGRSYYSSKGSYGRQKLLEKWKKCPYSSWKFTYTSTQSRGKRVALKLEEEVCKRQKLESECKQLTTTVKKQVKKIASLQTGTPVSYRQSSKCYSRQQKYNIKQKLAKNVTTALSFCDENNFQPHEVTFKNTDNGKLEKLNITAGKFTSQENCDVVSSKLTLLRTSRIHCQFPTVGTRS